MGIIKERERCHDVEYKKCFYFDKSGGYGFDCDEHGNVFEDNLNPDAKENYKWCLENLDKFYREPFIEKRSWDWTEPALFECECKEQFPLENQFMGTCQCPNCGQWVNLFGQFVLPPDEWEENCNEE